MIVHYNAHFFHVSSDSQQVLSSQQTTYATLKDLKIMPEALMRNRTISECNNEFYLISPELFSDVLADPEAALKVKELIVGAGCPRLLSERVPFMSQSYEDKVLYQMLRSNDGVKCNEGVIFEIGGLTGTRYSNSFFFEYALGWKSILVEAHPENFAILEKNRLASINFHAAICDGESIEFQGWDAVGGVVQTMDAAHKGVWIDDAKHTVFKVPCRKLDSIFKEANVRHIDIFSLDVEGGESMVLENMDWSVSVGLWLVETAGTPERIQKIYNMLEKHGYVAASWDIGDGCPIKGDCFKTDCTGNKVFVPVKQ